MNIVEDGITETLGLAARVLMKNPELSLNYLSMIPASYRNHAFFKDGIRYLEETAKEKLKR